MDRPSPASPAPHLDLAPATVDRARFLALFSAVMLPMFLAAVDQTIVATATPAIGQELGHLDRMPWLAVSYLVASILAVPLYGQAGDHFGRRKLLALAIGMFTLGSLACGLAPDFFSLVAARALQGLGGGGLMSLSQALIGEVLPPQQRARFQGWFAIVFVSASLLGPLIGAVVVEHASWRWLFLANLPLAAFALWRLRSLAGDDRTRPWSGGFDAAGMAWFAVAVVGTLGLLSEAGTAIAGDAAAVAGGVAVVALGWVMLARTERRVHARGHVPFLPVDLLAMPSIRTAVGVVFGFAAVMFAGIFFLPVYFHLALGVSVPVAAQLLLLLTGGIMVGTGITGRLIVRTGRTREFPIVGMAVAAVALLGMGLAPQDAGWLRGLTLLQGLGLGMVMSVMQIITQVIAGPGRLGGAAATVSLARSLGASAGAAAMGALVFGARRVPDLDALRADPAALAQVVEAFHHGFLAAAALAAATALLALRLPPIRLPQGAKPAMDT